MLAEGLMELVLVPALGVLEGARQALRMRRRTHQRRRRAWMLRSATVPWCFPSLR